MNRLAKIVRSVVLIAVLAGSWASLAQVATITSAGSARPVVAIATVASSDPGWATSQTITHRGKCAGGEYEMNISPDDKRVQILVPAARLPLDFSDSRFGKTFLSRPLLGRFLFKCTRNTVHVEFWGFEVGQKKPPRSVGYFLTLDNDGKVEKDTGLEDVALESMRTNMDSH